MNKMRLIGLAAAIMVLGVVVAAQQPDNPACKDHPLFPTRMPEYRLESCKVEEYGLYEFWVTKGPKVPVEGKYTFLTYAFTGPRANEPSGTAVVRNYENAIIQAGGTVFQSVPTWWVNGKFLEDGQEIWAQAEKGNGKIWLRIVEKKAMAQYVTADAAALAQGLKAEGHMAVNGILFDTGKATIKPESAQAIGEVAKLLKADLNLKVFVVGHTDTVGTVESNLKLSQDRAQAVLQALVSEHGIAAARLRAFGCGPFAPVTSNDSEEGRAKNRRVELVKQ